jgi:hypothetical protein
VAEQSETEAREPNEYERVLSYREWAFRRLGANLMQSISLAESGVDLHEFEKLLKRGCSLEHAIDILT